MGLQRLFSFSAESIDEPMDFGSPVMSRDSSGHPTVSSTGPDTPTAERPSLPYQLHLDFQDATKPLDFLGDASTSAVEAGDISFEMRLDSLHFEDLSFDVHRF